MNQALVPKAQANSQSGGGFQRVGWDTFRQAKKGSGGNAQEDLKSYLEAQGMEHCPEEGILTCMENEKESAGLRMAEVQTNSGGSLSSGWGQGGRAREARSHPQRALPARASSISPQPWSQALKV